RHTWISQANHIFCRLQITSNFEDYVVVEGIFFDLNIMQTIGDPPEGFLFLCPIEDFQSGPYSFCWPVCAAYWSLDPSGIDRLSPEDAAQLGFSSFKLTTNAVGSYWDASVYEGLHQFYQAKGFDSYSQDVARHLGLQLYHLYSQHDAPFVPDGEDFDADIDSDCNAYMADYPSISAWDDDDYDPDVEARSSHNNASESTAEDNVVAEEIFVPSLTFRIILYIQLVLILFLAVFGFVKSHPWFACSRTAMDVKTMDSTFGTFGSRTSSTSSSTMPNYLKYPHRVLAVPVRHGRRYAASRLLAARTRPWNRAQPRSRAARATATRDPRRGQDGSVVSPAGGNTPATPSHDDVPDVTLTADEIPASASNESKQRATQQAT
ncbi:hypothetical protein C8R45DRAFT_1178304, partial [Mycena sanguinolenta]